MSERRFLAAVAALALGAFAVLAGPDLVGADASTSVGILWLTGLTQLLWIALAVALAALADAAPVRARLGLRASRLGPLATLAAIAGIVLLSYAVNGVLVELQVRDTSNLERIDRIARDAREAAPWLALAVIALLPAIAEELLFRGAALEILRGRLGATGALLGSAVLFGAAHVEPIHAAAAAVLGLYLGAVALLGGSVWPAVACHLVNNGVGLATGWLSLPHPPTGAAPLLLAAALGCLAVAARAPRRTPPGTAGAPPALGSALDSPGGDRPPEAVPRAEDEPPPR